MALSLDPGTGWPAPGQPGLVWLGQAGFWIETGAHRVLIDPYLSDSLARKYQGQPNDHRRMMPPPVLPDDLPRPDIVLVTHAHTDHMDPDTLAPLARRFPDLPFVVPAARLDTSRDRISPTATLVPVDAGQVIAPLPGLTLSVLPAAHEALDRDTAGNHLFLGYAIRSCGITIYHSGDCIPYDGLAAAVHDLAADIALLPVNGRDTARLSSGIPGNFTLPEAMDLARSAEIPFLIPHHFGMFAFNTLTEADIDRAAQASAAPRIVKPTPGKVIRVQGTGHGSGATDRNG
jgi:L-ascorbate metabolism protein UlaG (beta-lactamase superfamily)